MRIESIWIILAVGVMALMVGCAGLLMHDGLNAQGALAASRLTARWSFVWFMLAWSASSMAALWPGGWRRTLLQRRRAIGLSFAMAHLIHAGFFLIAMLMFGEKIPAATLVGGGIGYLFVALMAATSNTASVRLLGPKIWQALHATGGWVIFVIFAFSYLGRIPEIPWLGVSATSLIMLALGMRIAVGVRASRAKAMVH